MRITHLLLTLAFLAITSFRAAAADLAKIDRTIAKEPAYKSKPRYCLLVFGPEAKTRIWLVLDGDVLYVDRNGNGDLTEKKECVPMPGFEKAAHPALSVGRKVTVGEVRDGTLTHTGLEVGQWRLRPGFDTEERVDELYRKLAGRSRGGILYRVRTFLEWPAPGQGQLLPQRIEHVAFVDAQGFLEFGDRPSEAPVIHFNGPLALQPLPLQSLVRGDNPAELRSCLGTPGLGRGTFATLLNPVSRGLVPPDTYPLAELEFPAREGRKELLRTKVLLNQHC